MNLNVGKVIEHVVREDHVGISALSRKLHVSRRTIYNWFNQKTLSDEIIYRIGKAIKHDFSKEFPDDLIVSDQESNTNKTSLTDEDDHEDGTYTASVDYWMNKYISLLEKYNELLRQTNNF